MATKKKTAKRAKGKRKAEATGARRTGDKASSASAKLLAMAKRGDFAHVRAIGKSTNYILSDVTSLVVTVAGSALSQDEVRGRRGK